MFFFILIIGNSMFIGLIILCQGFDDVFMLLIDFVNIVCGFYGGDFVIMYNIIRLVKVNNVFVGVYFLLLDCEGFGCCYIDFFFLDFFDQIVY